jgi:hypothetical protein
MHREEKLRIAGEECQKTGCRSGSDTNFNVRVRGKQMAEPVAGEPHVVFGISVTGVTERNPGLSDYAAEYNGQLWRN